MDAEHRRLEETRAGEVPWRSWGPYAFSWQGVGAERLVVTVNYASNQSQCYVRLPFEDLPGCPWRLQDRLQEVAYDRDGSDLQSRGLYLDAPPWQASIFALTRGTIE